VFGGVGTGRGYSVKRGVLLDSLSGMPALGAAEQGTATDMIGDLNTAHLLRPCPNAVFGNTLCGAIVSIFHGCGRLRCLRRRYPCIGDLGLGDVGFPPDARS